MHQNYMLENDAAISLYEQISKAPIYDYHCHLSPKEIFEDKPFDNIGEIWLSADHYKWRLMRTVGFPEDYITGNKEYKEKFKAYSKSISLAAGNPLYHWSHMELSQFFNIDLPLNEKNADEIWEKANDHIKQTKLSPRKCIELANVKYIATTDDPTDTLEYHQKLQADKDFKVTVAPSFRTDNLLLIIKDDYSDYIQKLSNVSGVKINNLKTLCEAVCRRLDYFVQIGCVFTDVGIPYFPSRIADTAEANKTFVAALKGKEITSEQYNGFLGYMYLFLASEYAKRNLIMQWHLAVFRNANSELFRQLGADCGVDCIGNSINGNDLIMMLDAIHYSSGLPETIIYTLNNGSASQIATIAGAFPKVHCGAAWWFCDHKRGIIDELNTIAENRALGTFYGMLTDSRSFLSYARHDYFRRILATFLGEMVEKSELDILAATEIIERVSYKNIANRIGGKSDETII